MIRVSSDVLRKELLKKCGKGEYTSFVFGGRTNHQCIVQSIIKHEAVMYDIPTQWKITLHIRADYATATDKYQWIPENRIPFKEVVVYYSMRKREGYITED